MPRALILGGTGAIGRAAAGRLLAAGWAVDVTGRDPMRFPAELADAGAGFIASDRRHEAQLRKAFGNGADLLVDCVCFTAADATRLLPFARDAGSTVMISSKAVYVDDEGRHSNSDAGPVFAGPISEKQPTVAPGDMDHNSREGYAANKVAAEQVLLGGGCPVTVLRPSKIHGAGAARPREWIFVNRVLDGRPAVFLANRGTGVDHPSAAVNIAALIEVVAAKPGARILNSADPDTPSALEISRTIARHLDHAWKEILLPDGADEGLGVTPWNTAHPIVLDMSAAAELGYAPVGDYAATVTAEVDWLVAGARGGPEAWLLPVPGDAFFDALLDYAAEDAYLEVAHC